VTEDGVLSTGGTLAVSDVDDGEAKFANVSGSSLHGTYGNFSFDEDTGAWSYDLRNGDANVQALNDGDSVTDQLTVWSLDHTASQTITVTIGGQTDNFTVTYMVNHGQSTVLEHDTIANFDFNDVLRYAGDLTYDGFTTGDVDGDGTADTVVTFHYVAGNGVSGGGSGGAGPDNGHGPDGGSGVGQATGNDFHTVEVTLLGYSGFDPQTQLNPTP
jgi:VCBS repeat-containing protein